MYHRHNTIEVPGARVHNPQKHRRFNSRKTSCNHRAFGSGKSSLAFDTIYAEGQRRYVETFLLMRRQFLGGLERPDVDKID
jgi:excinuclease ABC subunit A